MKKAVLAILALAGAVLSAQSPVLSPEQTLERRAIGELEFSPDHSRLAFTVTEAVKGSTRQRHLWLLDVGSGGVRQLTFSDKSDSSPRWAPDGRTIAFLSDRDGAAQIYLLPMAGGEAARLTDRKERIESFRWSPDGRQIALLMADAKSDALQKREKDKDDGRIAEKDDRMARVWTVDVATHALKAITSEPYRIGQIEFTPAGDRLIAAASPKPHADQFNEAIYSIDLSSGRFTPIASPRGPMGAMALSPDGKTVAYVCARVDGPEAHDLCVQPIAGGAMRNLTATPIDRPISQPKWIDNQTLAFGVARGFRSRIETIGLDGRAQTAVDPAAVNPSAFARATDGTLAYVAESAAAAPELWIKTPNAAARALTTLNASWTSRAVVTPEFVKYKSADGTEIEAALLKPQGASPQPLPAVILVHGGPTGRWSDSFEAWGQLLVARGYAVLYPNVRGSTGYGEHFVEMNRADWGGGDFTDVMAGADWLVARGIADPNRLGIGGWSYGGYMAAWAVTQTTRFKAAVSGAPVIDMASEFGTEGGSAYDEWFYGTPYEKLDGFIKSSPMTFVKNAKTPTLLLQGEDDTTDPIGQSQQFYRGLKRYGVDTDLVLYPREPHGLREEKHLVDRLTRILAWYDRYLKPVAASATPLPLMDTLFHVLVQNSSDAVVMLDADGAILFASESSARLLGYSLEERRGHSAFELMHPDDIAPTRAVFAECLNRPGVPMTCEYRIRHKDGVLRHMESIAVNRLDDPAVHAVVVNYRDVTERRAAADALRTSEERLRHIVERAQDLIYYCDGLGRFTYVNPTAVRVMGYNEEELLGRHFFSLVRKDQRHAVGEFYLGQLFGKTPTSYREFPTVTKSGGTIWVGQHVELVFNGDSVVGVHAIARDISRQKDAEDRLRQSEARYRSLIQGAAYGIYRTTIDGRILDANPALAAMVGYTVDELLSLNMSAIYKSADERAALIEQHPRDQHQALTTDIAWQKKDGTAITVRLTARVVAFDDGLSCFEGVVEDITEKRALEEQLRQALKMEAVGRLARGVAHDFNNVLAAIIGCSDLLALRLTPSDPSFDEAQEIRKAAERGAALTRQLLAFSRSQMLEAQVIDLDQIVPALDTMLQRMAGDGVTVRIASGGAPAHARIEPGQLEQVLMNLVVNARDAMPGGGTIDIRVDRVVLDERSVLRYPGVSDGPFARLTVTDTGEGIPPDMQPHLFEPFFTTKDPSKGTGLGLSIVYGIAKEAGGTVTFATAPNEGTTFEVLLPLAKN